MAKRVLLICTLVLALLSVGLSVSFAAPFYEGRPAQFDPIDSVGYFIWHDAKGWRLLTTSEDRTRHFSGVIRTDGEVYSVKPYGAEGSDRIRTDYQKDVVSFSFHTVSGMDGIVFQVRYASYLQFDLKINGQTVNPRYIFVGRQSWRPYKSPFRIDIE